MTKSLRITLPAALLSVVLTALPLLAQTRGVTAEDYFAFETLGDPRFSPDGATIAFVVTTVDQKQNRRRSAIWSVPSDGSREPIALTTAPQSSNSPRWSPDGKAIAFLSARPAPGDAPTDMPRTQVWLLPLGGGEPRRVTNLLNGASGFQWSPDGTRIVLLGRSGPSDTAKSPSDVRHYAHANYKFNDSGWFDDKRTHLWVTDVASGRSTQITSGEDWNDSDPQWSPDGRRIAFVSDRTGKAFDGSENTDVWVIDAGGGPLTKISDHATADRSPRWSPDGTTIAFLSSVPEKSHPRIWLAPSGGGAPSRLAADGIDLIPSGLRWAEGGRALYFETGFKGTSQLFRVDLAARKATAVTSSDRTVHFVDVSEPSTPLRPGKIAYGVNDPTHLDDLFVADLNGRNEKQLTHLNAALWKQLQLSPVERVSFKGADGWDVDGFFMKPIGWDAGKKYPMILTIHGGPAGMYGFDWYHEFQVYASRGWAVFFTNPRGSTGYGEKFERGIELNWGGKDYVDVMNGVDAALAKYPWIDTDRLGVTGGSYGGYLTNWIVSHTNRFKAAVTLRSISNFISDDGTRDGAYGHADDFTGDIFEKHDLYWNASPLKYVQNVKTPTLVLHSDNDFRVPIEQGEQWFRALRHFGVPSEIVFFPRENHNLTRTGEPKHLVESINWQVYWFDRYINGNARAVAPDAPGTLTFGQAPAQNQSRDDTVAPDIPGVVAGGTKVQFIKDGFAGTEGPIALPDGGFVFTETQASRITRIDSNGNTSTYLEDTNQSNGLAFDAKGRLISVQRGKPQVGVLTPTRTMLADNFEGQPFSAPNDLSVDKKGGVYFSDPGTNPQPGQPAPPKPALYYMRPDGHVIKLADDIARPNGVLLSSDEKTLYVANTNGQHVLAYDIQPDGSVRNRRNFAKLEGGRQTETGIAGGADGLAIDANGRLYVASTAGVQVFTSTGQHLGTIPVSRAPQNIAFAGPDKKTMYIVARGAAYKIAMQAQGFLGRAK